MFDCLFTLAGAAIGTVLGWFAHTLWLARAKRLEAIAWRRARKFFSPNNNKIR